MELDAKGFLSLVNRINPVIKPLKIIISLAAPKSYSCKTFPEEDNFNYFSCLGTQHYYVKLKVLHTLLQNKLIGKTVLFFKVYKTVKLFNNFIPSIVWFQVL